MASNSSPLRTRISSRADWYKPVWEPPTVHRQVLPGRASNGLWFVARQAEGRDTGYTLTTYLHHDGKWYRSAMDENDNLTGYFATEGAAKRQLMEWNLFRSKKR